MPSLFLNAAKPDWMTLSKASSSTLEWTRPSSQYSRPPQPQMSCLQYLSKPQWQRASRKNCSDQLQQQCAKAPFKPSDTYDSCSSILATVFHPSPHSELRSKVWPRSFKSCTKRLNGKRASERNWFRNRYMTPNTSRDIYRHDVHDSGIFCSSATSWEIGTHPWTKVQAIQPIYSPLKRDKRKAAPGLRKYFSPWTLPIIWLG